MPKSPNSQKPKSLGKILIWRRAYFQCLRWLSFLWPIRLRRTMMAPLEAEETIIKTSRYPLYRLSPDLVFVFDRFSYEKTGIQVVLKTYDEKRTLSVPKPLFELLFVKYDPPSSRER